MDSDGTLPRVKKRRRVNSKLNDDSKEILIKAKSADIFPKLQCMSSAHLSSENYFQSPISKLQNNTSVTFSESELSTEDSSDNYEDNVPVSGSFIPTISDSSDEFFSNADFSSDSDNYFSDSSINSDSSYSDQVENAVDIGDFLREWFHGVKLLLKVH